MKNENEKNTGVFSPLLRGVAQLVVTGCFLFSTLSAQTTGDKRLNDLKANLPKGWEMVAQIEPWGENDDPTLFLFLNRIDSIKVLEVNKINAENGFDKGLAERVKKDGRTIKLSLIMKLEPKWDKTKYDKVLAFDDSLDAEKKKLFTQYKIDEIQKPHPLGKGQFVFDDSTPDKKARLTNYNEGCYKLDKLKKPWPNYNTSNYAAFFYYDYEQWAFREAYPNTAEAEEYQVVQLIQEILKSDY